MFATVFIIFVKYTLKSKSELEWETILGTRDWQKYPPTIAEVHAWRKSMNEAFDRGIRYSWNASGFNKIIAMGDTERRFEANASQPVSVPRPYGRPIILRLGRLRLRGPRGAQFEFTLAAIAQNLRRLAKLAAHPPPDMTATCVA
jgi:hypothetical protein